MVKLSELQYLTVDDQEDEYQDVVESDAFAIHMNAMTAEHLHSKSEIAVELARRDMKVESLERERDGLREALNEIANPIRYMRKTAEKEGSKLNSLMALELSNDPHYLKDIALKALAKGADHER